MIGEAVDNIAASSAASTKPPTRGGRLIIMLVKAIFPSVRMLPVVSRSNP